MDGLDQGLKASSSEAEGGMGGSRADRGKDRGMMDGWGIGKDCRKEGLGHGKKKLEGGERMRETWPLVWKEGQSQQGVLESC